jgi:ubiquinone/menaquinone biosynthesis C-methylase UbiE
MNQEEAIQLIKTPEISNVEPSAWADLGAGSGTFTLALSKLLAPGSSIYAVDQLTRSLKAIPAVTGITIEKIPGDFTDTTLVPENLNGILMANALHFVKDKMEFLKKISAKLSPGGIFLIVEYDLQRSSPWVPYPLPFAFLEKLFADGLERSVYKLGEMPSRYNRSMIYGAVAR